MKAPPACPVCKQPGAATTVRRERLPAMQNYVHRSVEEARSARSGSFDLAACAACGFAHNAAFDARLLSYDEGYDNSVPSTVMSAYYREIAAHLGATYRLDEGPVMDVGCGKGTLLGVLAEMFPQVRGVGIDPSYTGGAAGAGSRVRFIQDVFSADQIDERPAVVVCRHVVEHIPEPVPFLRSLGDALTRFPGTPLFLEVPDLEWIIRQAAFWDFCYEHCNYFTAASLSEALHRAGLPRPHRVSAAFQKQYLWMELRSPGEDAAAPAPGDQARPDGSGLQERLGKYAAGEADLMERARRELQHLKEQGYGIALWGMATKGVVYAAMLDAGLTLVDYCIDINPNKQGSFVPLTGHVIKPPVALARGAAQPLAVIVMNPNYLGEIRDACAGLSLTPLFMDAGGAPL